jgi:hypothetical protein
MYRKIKYLVLHYNYAGHLVHHQLSSSVNSISYPFRRSNTL